MHDKKRSAPKSQYTVIAFLGLRVGTVPFGATAEACAENKETANGFFFRGRDVLTMNSVKILHAVRSVITATAAELLVIHFSFI